MKEKLMILMIVAVFASLLTYITFSNAGLLGITGKAVADITEPEVVVKPVVTEPEVTPHEETSEPVVTEPEVPAEEERRIVFSGGGSGGGSSSGSSGSGSVSSGSSSGGNTAPVEEPDIQFVNILRDSGRQKSEHELPEAIKNMN